MIVALFGTLGGVTVAFALITLGGVAVGELLGGVDSSVDTLVGVAVGGLLGGVVSFVDTCVGVAVGEVEGDDVGAGSAVGVVCFFRTRCSALLLVSGLKETFLIVGRSNAGKGVSVLMIFAILRSALRVGSPISRLGK